MIQVDVVVAWNCNNPVLKDRRGLSVLNPIYFSNYASFLWSFIYPSASGRCTHATISKRNHFIHRPKGFPSSISKKHSGMFKDHKWANVWLYRVAWRDMIGRWCSSSSHAHAVPVLLELHQKATVRLLMSWRVSSHLGGTWVCAIVNSPGIKPSYVWALSELMQFIPGCVV